MTRTRLNIFIEPAHAKRLDQVSAHKGVSKSAVIAAALASFLSPDGEDQREAALAKRLDRLSRQFDRLERDQGVLIETVALYLRHYLTVALPVPEQQQEAMRAQGRARYAQFIEQLARHIQRGRSLVREIHQEIEPAAPAQQTGEGHQPPSSDGASHGDDPAMSSEGEKP
ncbi:CopG family transcriptional regulator [Variovorax sp. NFACC27]|uniref:CopG family transcriptional regulator n=1 Tax=unclassified Variovorax TaxID=663243 RepID=UPI00089A2DD5|nr:hypothetical protein SAMN03159371_03306 [Variovorax sp. NFACC28]SEG70417.1 hypothetical protein SAMN03159365_03219 [Variovorax sp. NFACC29]SFC82660.1 hypothetical protein SAMN03159379_03275 [Variovorax sp. NFACC26]SFF98273.1 hypothetical protein SAMN03159447_01216 [Variovorax sp. NFACC27]